MRERFPNLQDRIILLMDTGGGSYLHLSVEVALLCQRNCVDACTFFQVTRPRLAVHWTSSHTVSCPHCGPASRRPGPVLTETWQFGLRWLASKDAWKLATHPRTNWQAGLIVVGSWWMFAATSRAFRESCGVVPQQEGTAVATHEKSSLFSAQLGCWGHPCKEKVHTSELQRHSHCNWQILSALWQWKSTFWQQSSPGLLWCPFWLVSSRRRAASERRNTSRERIGRRNWGPV